MLKFLKAICQISAQSYKQLRSYRHFKIRTYISLEGRMAAADMLLILKLITISIVKEKFKCLLLILNFLNEC